MPPPNPTRRWAVYFLVLVGLAGAAAVAPVVFNLRQQLRPEQLAAARERWRQHGPRDYDLEYTLRVDRDLAPERYLVQVRGGRVVFVARDGEVVRLDPAVGLAAGLPARAFPGDGEPHDVEALFAHMERRLREADEAGRRDYLRGVFDEATGYPRQFVRRQRGSDQREEWNLRLWGPGEARESSPRGRR